MLPSWARLTTVTTRFSQLHSALSKKQKNKKKTSDPVYPSTILYFACDMEGEGMGEEEAVAICSNGSLQIF